MMMSCGYVLKGRHGALRARSVAIAIGVVVILVPFLYNFLLSVQSLESTHDIFAQDQVLYDLLSPDFFIALASFVLGERVGTWLVNQ